MKLLELNFQEDLSTCLMNKYLLIILILFSCNSASKIDLVIHDVNVIDPIKGLSESKSILISNNKIVRILDSEKLNISRFNEIIFASDKFIIPGLWDAHVHFYFDTYLANYMPDLFLKFGVTSVRDTGGEFEFLDSIKKLSIKFPKSYPRIKIAGPLIDGKYNVYNGQNLPELSIQTKDESETSKAAKELISKGVDFLKAYEMLSPSQYEEVLSIAKKNNLRVAGHVPLSMDIITASKLGLSSLEHVKNLEMWATHDRENLLKQRREILKNHNGLSGLRLRASVHNSQKDYSIRNLDSLKLIEIYKSLLENDTWQVPTLSIYKVPIYKIFKDEFWMNSFSSLPKQTKERWTKNAISSSSNINPKQKNFSDWIQKTTREMNSFGINFMAGTDTPLGYLTPGFSLHKELELLVESGLSEIEAIKSATYNPSVFFNMQDSLGLIRKDFIADLVILNSNPLENIVNTLDIYSIIVDGEIYESKF